MMNARLILVILMVLPTLSLVAQEQTGRAKERVEAFRVAFYTREMSLSAEEAQRFWPVYNEYAAELEENRKKQRSVQASLRQAYTGGSDEEINTLLDQLMDLKGEETDITLQYHQIFKEVLPIRKVAILYKAETEFKRKLLENLQERRQERRNGTRP